MDGFGQGGVIDGFRAVLVLLSRRREIVCAAYAVGITKSELHALTRISRTTIDSWTASINTDGEHR